MSRHSKNQPRDERKTSKIISTVKDSLNESRNSLPSENPISMLVDALSQTPLHELQQRDRDAYTQAEAELRLAHMQIHDNAQDLSKAEIQKLQIDFDLQAKSLKRDRIDLARAQNNPDEEQAINQRFEARRLQLEEDFAQAQDDEVPEQTPIPPEDDEGNNGESDSDPDEDVDSGNSTPEQSFYVPRVTTPSHTTSPSNSGCLSVFVFFAILAGLIAYLPRACEKPKEIVKPPRVVQREIDPPPPPKVIEVKQVEPEPEPIVIHVKKPKDPGLTLNGKTYNIGDTVQDEHDCKYKIRKAAKPLGKFDGSTNLSETLLNALREKIIKRIGEPKFSSCKDYSYQMRQRLCCLRPIDIAIPVQKQKTTNEPKHLGNGIYIIDNPGLQLGTETFPVGSLIIDHKGCSYKVLKESKPEDEFRYLYNRDACIYHALEKHYIKKFPTEACPYDTRMEY